MSSSNIHQSTKYQQEERKSIKSMSIYPFNLRKSIDFTVNINSLLNEKEEALKPLDYLDDYEDEPKTNHQIILVSERSCDSYCHILNDNIKLLQKEMFKSRKKNDTNH